MSYTIIGTERFHTIISYYRGGVTVAKNSVHNQLSVSQGRVMDHVLAPAQCTPLQDSRLRITSRDIGIPLVFPKKLKISFYIQYFPKKPSCFPQKTPKNQSLRVLWLASCSLSIVRENFVFKFFGGKPYGFLSKFHIHTNTFGFLGKTRMFSEVTVIA